MATMSAPSHSIIQRYLTDQLSGDERQQLTDRSDRDETARSLLNLLDLLRTRYHFRDLADKDDDPIPPSVIVACLQDLWAGRFDHPQLDTFARQLFHSAGFYERLFLKLEEQTEVLAPAVPGELDGITLPSREEVFASAGIHPRRKPLIIRLAGWSRENPGWFAAAAVLLLLLLAGPPAWIAINRDREDSPGYYVDAGDNLPYALPDIPSLRSTENDSGRSIEFRKLLFAFQSGLSSYNGHDFIQAIKYFRQATPEAEQLRNRADTDSLTLRILRDRYFYLGLSLLKVSRVPDLAPSVTEKYVQEAIQTLNQAKRLSLKYQLSQADRDRYFLGIAYEFAGDIRMARSEMEAIPSGSKFYPDSQKLRRKWDKN